VFHLITDSVIKYYLEDHQLQAINITQRSIMLFGGMIVAQLVKKFPSFYETMNLFHNGPPLLVNLTLLKPVDLNSTFLLHLF
jgi:hypothetical protein